MGGLKLDEPLKSIGICPGTLIPVAAFGDSGRAVVLRTLAHEMGHFIPENFTPPSVFSSIDSLEDVPWVRALRSELSADYWAMEVLIADFARRKLTSDEIRTETVYAWGKFCPLRRTDPHLDGRFRIQSALNSHSAIRNLF